MLCAPRNDIDLCIFTWLAGINGVGLGLLILSLALPPNRRIGIFFYPWLVTPLEIFFFTSSSKFVSKDLLFYVILLSRGLWSYLLLNLFLYFTSLHLLNSSHCEQIKTFTLNSLYRFWLICM